MGSLFRSKTKSTSTSSTKVPENYQNFLNMSLGRAEAAGTKGFTQYTAPRIAELSGNEQAGINAAGTQAGMYQPVVNMAMQATQDMMGNATPDANQYINPYVNYVLGNSLDRLQEQSDTNMTKIGSQAAMSGAFGGLRHGVLEGANLGELLKSARDLSATTYSDAYDKGMDTWFKAQGNQRANIGNAIQNVRGAQDYNTQDMQRLMSTGLTERTRNQAGLDFGYSEFMREDQDDLNKASFLSTIAAQYPRDLFTKTNVTETTQSDSPIKTLAGIGLAAAGIMSGNPAATAGLAAGSKALPTSPAFNTGSGISWGAPSTSGNMGGGDFSDPFWKFNKGGLVKKYADGGMVKAGLGMMAGMDPLEAVTEHLKQAKEDGEGHFLGGFLAYNENRRNRKFDRMRGNRQEEAQIQPVAQRQPFDWDTFLRNMNFSSFTKPSVNTVNPNYGAPSSMPQFNQTYTPMNQQRVPLAAGIPGPGGPQSLQGNTLQRPVAQDPVNEPLSVYAKGGKVKSPAWQRKEGKNPEGGLNAKGRAAYNRETGGNLKAPQPEGGSRRDSFCARMGGMKKKLTSEKTANDPDSRINKALRKWKCASGGLVGYAGGGRVGPDAGGRKYDDNGNRIFDEMNGDGWDLGVPAPDDNNDWLIMQMLGLDRPETKRPRLGMSSTLKNAYPELGALGDLSEIQAGIANAKKTKELQDYVARKPLLKQNDATEARLKKIGAGNSQGNPLDLMITKLQQDVAKTRALNELSMQMGEPLPFNEEDVRKEDALRYLNDSTRAFPQELIEAERVRKQYEYAPGSPLEELNKRRLNGPGMPSQYDNKDTRAYQDGGFVQGGKSFEKNQARVPSETVDPLTALYYGMDSSAGKFQPDFKNLGRDDVLGRSVGEGTITKAQARNQVPQFDTMSEVIDSLPVDPNVETRSFTPAPMPAYTKSRMWDGVNEDVFMDGTFKNEQDPGINDKNLSLNRKSGAFGQHQYLPSTWNTYVTRVPKEIREQLGIVPVNEAELKSKKYKSGDPRLAKLIPSFAARDYVYRNYYLPDSVDKLKKAKLPVTELNLYLAHHLGQDGAVKAIPLLNNPKYAKKTMKQALLDAGLTTAANSEGNPWDLSVSEYKRQKANAYAPYKTKYHGETIEEALAKPQFADLPSEPMPFNDADYLSQATRARNLNPPTGYRDVMRELLAPGNHRGVNALPMRELPEVSDTVVLGGKRFAGGGRIGPKSNVQTLTMPEDEEDWKQREPGIFEKVTDRAKDPKVLGWLDDIMHGVTGGWASPSTSGKLPTDQKIVLPIDEKGWNYKPNPNLHMDALGEWGNSGDPVDNFYSEMSNMIGQTSGDPLSGVEPESGTPVGPGGGVNSAPEVDETDPEFEMLRELYKNQLQEYKDAQTKPKKGAVFGMFDSVNEPLLKLGLSILASKGSFGEALGEAGLSSLADRDKKQMEKSQEASAKLQEILKLRYTNAMIESMDPRIKGELARQAQAAKSQDLADKLKVEREKAGLAGQQTRLNNYLNHLIKLRENETDYVYSEEQLKFLNDNGYPVSNPEDKGTSLF